MDDEYRGLDAVCVFPVQAVLGVRDVRDYYVIVGSGDWFLLGYADYRV